MTGTRVAVFSVGRARRRRFLVWASLVGPQVALVHASRGEPQLRAGRTWRAVVYRDDVVVESIDATIERTAAIRPAPRFVFLQAVSASEITEVSDPRIWSTDLDDVRDALWDFVAAESVTDPEGEPTPGLITAPVTTPPESAIGPVVVPVLAAGKPWWCKLFRSGPGC